MTPPTVGIVGLGYVGLPLAVAFAEAGHEVVGVELSAPKVASVNRGESYATIRSYRACPRSGSSPGRSRKPSRASTRP